MVIIIPEIQPFTFQAGTAFSERVQLANKINEIIDGINQIGDIPDLEGEIATLSSQIQAINRTITTIQNTMAQQGTTIQDIQGDISTLDEQMASAMSDITGLTSRITAAETALTEHESEISGLLGEVIDSVEMSSTAHGTVQVQINHEDGSNDISAPIDLGLIQTGGITLQTGASDRSFKLIINQTNGESWQTNDFIIPPGGGGTDVTITSITLKAGTTADTMMVSIGLSDGTPLDSNDYPVVTPAQYTALATRVTATEGNISQHTAQINSLNERVTALENAGGYTLVPATASQLGGVKIGANITVQSDGTISIPNATASTPGVMTAAQVEQLNSAATASTLMFTADASKVTLHADSVAGSAFTEDIPAAADGGAGTIDQTRYQQIATNQNNITTIQGKVTALESKVDGLTPSVSVNESADPPTITVGLNGKSTTANLPSGGAGSGPSFTVLNNTLDTSTNNVAKFAEWVANAKVGDNIKILGTFGSTGQFINTFDMSVVARDDDAKSLLLIGTGTARILSISTGHNGYWIPITTMSVIFTQASYPSFSGTVCYDTTGNNVVNISFPFNLGDADTYVLLTSY